MHVGFILSALDIKVHPYKRGSREDYRLPPTTLKPTTYGVYSWVGEDVVVDQTKGAVSSTNDKLRQPVILE